MSATPTPRFVSEPLRPVAGTVDVAGMATGSPGLPRQFAWGDTVLEVARVDAAWRETGPCRNGAAENYARKHWFEVTTPTGRHAKLYFERTARGSKRLERWWLYTLSD